MHFKRLHQEKRDRLKRRTLNTYLTSVERHEVSHGEKRCGWIVLKRRTTICVRCKRHINPGEDYFKFSSDQFWILKYSVLFKSIKILKWSTRKWLLSAASVMVIFNFLKNFISNIITVLIFCWWTDCCETVVVENFWKRPLGCSLAMIQMNIGGFKHGWFWKWIQNGVNVFADFELALCFIMGDDP